jgi:hypothetical protein
MGRKDAGTDELKEAEVGAEAEAEADAGAAALLVVLLEFTTT